jgi:hypothetical protein
MVKYGNGSIANHYPNEGGLKFNDLKILSFGKIQVRLKLCKFRFFTHH